MSGTLMDGGQGGDGAAFVHSPQANQGGHAVQGGDSLLADGGQQTHNGHVQAGQGGEGFLASLLGQNSHNNFLSHLLGLDQASNHGHGHGAQGGQAGHGHSAPGQIGTIHSPSQSAALSSVLSAMKLSNFMDGLSFTPAMGMFCLFSGFVIWLFVVYFVRHHEPFANSVLGTVPQSLTAATDRELINGVRGAMPYKTTKDTGTVYEPLPGEQQSTVQPFGQPGQNLTSMFGTPRAMRQVQANANGYQGSYMSSPAQSYSNMQAPPSNAFGSPDGSAIYTGVSGEPNYSMSTVNQGGINKLKTIVSH